MDMQIILNEDVPNLGRVGDVVSVKSGYGRNYLIPRKLAVLATTRNIKEMEHTRRIVGVKRAKAVKSAGDLASRLKDVSLTIAKQVGEEDKLFGSVTNRDIEDALKKEGFSIDRRNIVLEKPIKNLGVYNVDVKLHTDITTQVKVWVVSE